MATAYQRAWTLTLPLPFAQLYSASNNARQAPIRAEKAEALIKTAIQLTAASLYGCYLSNVAGGQGRNEAVDTFISRFANPKLSDWGMVLTALSRHFGERPDAGTHPYGHLEEQLSATRPDLAGLYGLHSHLEEILGDSPIDANQFSIRRALDSFIAYCEEGKSEGDDDTITHLVPDSIILPALHELLDADNIQLLGPEGTRLLWIEEVRTLDSNRKEIDGLELIGVQGERISPIEVSAEEAEKISPERVAISWPGRICPVTLDPLVHYRQGDMSAELLFLNRDAKGKGVEFVSCTNGEKIKDKELVASLAGLLGGEDGADAEQGNMATLADLGELDVDLDELAPSQFRVRLLDIIKPGDPTAWVFSTDDKITIGREPANLVVLLSPRVSRRHGSIAHDGNSWQYKNWGSNGTLKDGTRVDEFPVENGMIVQLAPAGPRIQFELPEI